MQLRNEPFVFGSDDQDFLKEAVQAYLTAPISPSFFYLGIYGRDKVEFDVLLQLLKVGKIPS
jgi:hypothetical protein